MKLHWAWQLNIREFNDYYYLISSSSGSASGSGSGSGSEECWLSLQRQSILLLKAVLDSVRLSVMVSWAK